MFYDVKIVIDNIFPIFVSFNPDQVTKAAGDSAYLRNDFQTAIQIYEALLKQGEAAEVYYNLGNSYYKINDIAHAILNYERALLLSPGNSDIRANLEIARAKTIDKIASIPDIFFIGWFKTLINSLSIDAWSYLAIVCFVFFLLCLGLFFYSKSVRGKKIGFISGFILLIVVILCNVFALQQKKKTYEEVLQRQLDNLNNDYAMLKMQGQELAMRNLKGQNQLNLAA